MRGRLILLCRAAGGVTAAVVTRTSLCLGSARAASERRLASPRGTKIKQTVRKLSGTSSAAPISRPVNARIRKNGENSLSAWPYGASHRVFARSARIPHHAENAQKSGTFDETGRANAKAPTTRRQVRRGASHNRTAIDDRFHPKLGYYYIPNRLRSFPIRLRSKNLVKSLGFP